MKIKNRLRQAREARGLSRYRVHKDTGISYPTLISIEFGRGEPTAEIRQRLSDYLEDPFLFWLDGQEAALAEVS